MDDLSTRLAGLVVLVAVCVVAGLVARARNGRVRLVADGDVVSADDLQAPLGGVATLVQFSTVVCTPCRATSRLLAAIADEVPGVVHVEVDAEQRLDLARRFDVLRAPTVLIADAAGRVVSRSSGVPEAAAVREVVSGLLAAPSRGATPSATSVITPHGGQSRV